RVATHRLFLQRQHRDAVQIRADSRRATRRHRARRWWWTLTDLPRQGAQRAIDTAIGTLPGEEMEKEHAERVDIARGRDWLATNVLRTRKGQREGPQQRHRGRVAAGRCDGVEDLGNSKVQEFDRAVPGDEYVARLEVAVHDQVPVCMAHGVAH